MTREMPPLTDVPTNTVARYMILIPDLGWRVLILNTLSNTQVALLSQRLASSDWLWQANVLERIKRNWVEEMLIAGRSMIIKLPLECNSRGRRRSGHSQWPIFLQRAREREGEALHRAKVTIMFPSSVSGLTLAVSHGETYCLDHDWCYSQLERDWIVCETVFFWEKQQFWTQIRVQLPAPVVTVPEVRHRPGTRSGHRHASVFQRAN